MPSFRPWPAFVTLGILVLLPLAPARARSPAQEHPRAANPWAVRADTFVVSGSGVFGATASALGVTVQRTLWGRFAWEELIARGVGNRKVDGEDVGWVLGGTGRGALWLSNARTHAVTLGLGSALIIGGGYGTLNFAFAEFGYEFRSAAGFSVLLALGPNVLLNKPKVDLCRNDSWFCENFARGDFVPLGHARLGIGWAF